nr:hypothetical protein [uncultured Draconibacterium sp.]
MQEILKKFITSKNRILKKFSNFENLIISPGLSMETKHLLTDKAVFAKKVQKQGFPIIEGNVIFKGSKVSEKQLFQQSSLFFKPLCGSQQIGIYRIVYQASSGNYSLIVSAEKI